VCDEWNLGQQACTVIGVPNPAAHLDTSWRKQKSALSSTAVRVFCSPVFAAMNPHPRIWITTPLITLWKAKACLNPDGSPLAHCKLDEDYVFVKRETDNYLAAPKLIFFWTITDCTNARPMVCSTAEAMPMWNGAAVFFGGATGAWATSIPRIHALATKLIRVDATHFRVDDIDSTSFGSFGRQKVINFWRYAGVSTPILNYEYVGRIGWTLLKSAE